VPGSGPNCRCRTASCRPKCVIRSPAHAVKGRALIFTIHPLMLKGFAIRYLYLLHQSHLCIDHTRESASLQVDKSDKIKRELGQSLTTPKSRNHRQTGKRKALKTANLEYDGSHRNCSHRRRPLGKGGTHSASPSPACVTSYTYSTPSPPYPPVPTCLSRRYTLAALTRPVPQLHASPATATTQPPSRTCTQTTPAPATRTPTFWDVRIFKPLSCAFLSWTALNSSRRLSPPGSTYWRRSPLHRPSRGR